MIDRKTALGHDLLQVAIGERVSQIPANAEQDDRVFEVPPAEQCRPFSHHRYTLPNPLSAFATHAFSGAIAATNPQALAPLDGKRHILKSVERLYMAT
jgi:hypothetical protein